MLLGDSSACAAEGERIHMPCTHRGCAVPSWNASPTAARFSEQVNTGMQVTEREYEQEDHATAKDMRRLGR